jgi:CysZ protein
MQLLRGGQIFLSGLQLALSPALRRYVVIPASIGVLIFSLTLAFVVAPLGGDAGDWLQQNMPEWLSWLNALLLFFIYLTLGLAGFWLSSLLVTLIAAPFLGQLAQATWALSKPQDEPQNNQSLLGSVAPSVLRELHKLRYHLPRLLGLVLLSLVPGINVVMPFVWLGFSAWLMAAQFADYASENQEQPFRYTLQQLAQSRGRALGFGACTSFTLAIPFLNFLVVPVAVVGGTLLWQSITEDSQS